MYHVCGTGLKKKIVGNHGAYNIRKSWVAVKQKRMVLFEPISASDRINWYDIGSHNNHVNWYWFIHQNVCTNLEVIYSYQLLLQNNHGTMAIILTQFLLRHYVSRLQVLLWNRNLNMHCCCCHCIGCIFQQYNFCDFTKTEIFQHVRVERVQA